MGFPELRTGDRNSWILFLTATASMGDHLPQSLCPIIAIKTLRKMNPSLSRRIVGRI